MSPEECPHRVAADSVLTKRLWRWPGRGARRNLSDCALFWAFVSSGFYYSFLSFCLFLFSLRVGDLAEQHKTCGAIARGIKGGKRSAEDHDRKNVGKDPYSKVRSFFSVMSGGPRDRASRLPSILCQIELRTPICAALNLSLSITVPQNVLY